MNTKTAAAGLYSSAGSSECIEIAATMNKVLAASAVCAESGDTAESGDSGEHIHPDGTCSCKKGYQRYLVSKFLMILLKW